MRVDGVGVVGVVTVLGLALVVEALRSLAGAAHPNRSALLVVVSAVPGGNALDR